MSKNKTRREFKGIKAAPGIAIGPLYQWHVQKLDLPTPYPVKDQERAWNKIRSAIDQTQDDIQKMKEQVAQDIGQEEAAIFAAHSAIVEDVTLHELVKEKLAEDIYPEKAWLDAVENFAKKLENLPDPTLSARAADIRDVGRQVLAKMLGIEDMEQHMPAPSIILARDLSPSQTARMDREKVKAFCTAGGGKTSHTAILAKALGVPALVGMGEDILQLPEGSTAIVDASRESLIVHPQSQEIISYRADKESAQAQFQEELQSAHEPASTRDNHQVEIAANIGNVQDAEDAVRFGAESIGLFRTEFLYLDRTSIPSIEQQVQAYQEIVSVVDGRPLVVRTLDIGGDKEVPYLGFKEEHNPFLGWRAIRIIDEHPEILENQFYALLQASQGTDLRIMVPLVSQVSEVLKARDLLDKALDRVRSQNQSFSIDLQFGIMVEVPSAALLAEEIASHVDFFSIGTNDLTQYTMAVDRMNARVSSLASPYSPAVLKLIQRTVEKGHQHDIWVGMCGEFAGQPLAAPLLLGLDLDELSMSPRQIPAIKRVIRNLDYAETQKVARDALHLASAEAVRNLLKTTYPDLE